MCLNSTCAMHRCKAKASTNDERVPIGAGVESGERITNSLNCRWGKGSALADVEVHESAFTTVREKRLPEIMLTF